MHVVTFVVLQLIISAKAGLVNYVEGPSNVRLHEQVERGTTVETGSGGHVELLLNPGTFLRMDENSSVKFESIELSDIAIHVVSGTAKAGNRLVPRTRLVLDSSVS
jgi:hypothetical protein